MDNLPPILHQGHIHSQFHFQAAVEFGWIPCAAFVLMIALLAEAWDLARIDPEARSSFAAWFLCCP
jgi:hypothetical protein